MITFPPGVLSAEPVRLDVLARGAGWFAIDKPPGLLLAPDAVHPEDAQSIVAAIHQAAAAGKPQLAALDIGGCARIHAMDAEVSGVAVLATDPSAAATLRDALGSGRWRFHYEFVAEAADAPAQLECDLPLVRHGGQPRIIVSHRGGKRCRTAFLRLQALGSHALWSAVTAENRLHQVRVHAAECGLRIPGETVYGRVRPVFLSSLKRGYRRGAEDERPLHAGLALHLHRVSLGQGSELIDVESPRPKSLAALVRRLEDRA